MNIDEERFAVLKAGVIKDLRPEKRFGDYYFVITPKHEDKALGAFTETLFSVDTFVEGFWPLLSDNVLPTADNLYRYIRHSKSKGLDVEDYLEGWFATLPPEDD